MTDNQKNSLFCGICSTITIICCILQFTIKPRKNYSLEIYESNLRLKYEQHRADLVDAIDFTIREAAPNTSMNALEILNQCEKNDIDLFFVLAQGHVESHYGTKGLAQKTNSVFNVFAYDGKGYKDICKKGKYSHPDLSIEPYMHLLKNRYLVDGKTEMDLLENYVDKDGKRYASSKTYELQLRNIYNSLKNNESLNNAYDQYMKYKILIGS